MVFSSSLRRDNKNKMPQTKNPNPPGVPRTEEQRKAEHKITYGSEELPPRGSGLQSNPGVESTKEEYENNIKILADLETIRVNQFIPFNLTKVMTSGIAAASQKLIFDVFEPGYVYVITSICAYCVGKGSLQIKIGVTDGATDLVFESATTANDGDSVEYVGQLMLKETDKVYAEFIGAGATDTIRVNMNGYKIRR